MKKYLIIFVSIFLFVSFSIESFSTELSVTLTKYDVVCGETGSASILVNSSCSGNPTIEWSGGFTGNTITNLEAGNYSVTITDDVACGDTIIDFTIATISFFNVSIVVTGNFCNGPAIATANVYGANPSDITFSWNTTPVQNTQNITINSPGNYIVTANNETCSDSDNINMVGGDFDFEVVYTPTFCNGESGSAGVNIIEGVGPYLYEWSTGSITPGINITDGGNYWVSVIDISSGCSDIRYFTIAENSPVSVIIESDNISCYGQVNGSATAVVTGGAEPYEYMWSTFIAAESIYSLMSGNYAVTVEDANGCTGTASVFIAEPSQFFYSITPNQEICAGELANIDVAVTGGVEPYHYIWSDNPSLNIPNRIVEPLETTNYRVTVLDNNLCTYTPQETIITVHLPQDTIYIYDGFCTDSYYLFNGTLLFDPGIYFYNGVSEISGCDSIVRLELSLFEQPDLHLGPDIVACLGNSVVIDAGDFNNYLWSNDSQDSIISPIISGNYSVTVNDYNGCSAHDSINLNFVEPPNIQICFVEFDSITLRNRLNWLQQGLNVNEIKIYREISTDIYSHIGTVSNSETSFIDTNSNPQNLSYSYKIAAVDTCENEGLLSDFHKTITLLSTYDTNTDTYGFTWSQYVGLSIANYFLFGITNSNDVIQIASIPGSSNFYNYTNPSPIFTQFYIGFYIESCNSKSNYFVKSNVINSPLSVTESKIDIFTIYPNPSDKFIKINTDCEIFSIEIINIFGQTIMTVENSQEIDVSNLESGTYIFKMKSKDKRGITQVVIL